MRRKLAYIAALATVAALGIFGITSAVAAQGAGALDAPTGSLPQTGPKFNPTHWQVQIGDTITATIKGATDKVVGSGGCGAGVLVIVKSGIFGNTNLCGSVSGNDITFTWHIPSSGVCETTIVAYNNNGNNANNSLITPGGTSPGGLAIVDASGNIIHANQDGTCPGTQTAPPSISKDAAGSYDDTFYWDIQKSADPTFVQLGGNGGTATISYTVIVHHGDSVDTNVQITGTITVNNPNAFNLDITSVTDVFDSTACTVTGGGAQTLPPGPSNFSYTCTLPDGQPPDDLFNTATVSWPAQSGLDAGSASFTTPNAVVFTKNEIDECVDVTDTIGGTLGTVCVGDANPYEFDYTHTFNAPPLGTCEDHPNTATFTTNDTGATGDASASVTICNFRDSLTIGYWRNHMHLCGPKEKPGAAGCANNGPFTASYLPKSLGPYVVDAEAKATAVFDANNCSNAASSANNAIGCLAAQLLAAKLNVANGGNVCINATISAADAFLAAIPKSPSGTIAYSGPSGNYSSITAAGRATAISLKDKLDYYNNNSSCV